MLFVFRVCNVPSLLNAFRVSCSAPSVPIPVHFFGALAKSELGCDVIRRSGHLQAWAIQLSGSALGATSPLKSPSQSASFEPRLDELELDEDTKSQYRGIVWSLVRFWHLWFCKTRD